ncbi:hypothetical protein, partial [Pseudomonas poae]|uniref:hypothetical protein n=1 Tax=Pseudomonas poae TaxID=200451 RepID=UPI001EE389EC
LRWAAQQPQNQALSRIRYTAFCWMGGASHPNAGQARSPQDSVEDGLDSKFCANRQNLTLL